jgi:hypothetical protein
MTNNTANELRDKILHGVSLAYQRLIQTKQKENAEVAISRDGKIVRIKATELKG